MTAKELKEMIAQIPDDQEICCEIVCHDGEYLYAAPEKIDDDYTILMKEDAIILQDVLNEISKTYK